MNKKIGFIMVGFLMFSINGIARAEITTEPATGTKQNITVETQTIKTDREALKKEIDLKREAFKKDIQTQKDAFIKEVKTQKEEFKKTTEQQKTDFQGRAQEMFSKDYDMAVKNLENLQARVTSRIAKEKIANKDTTLEETALANSKTKLDAAKAKITEMKALIPVDGTKITADIFEKVKLGARDAKDLLKEAQQELVHVVTGLKGQGEQQGINDQQDKRRVEVPVQPLPQVKN